MPTTFRFDRKRRRLLQRAGAAAATATLGPLLITERTIAQTRTVYVNSWGGSYTAAQDAAFFKPFTAATGIQIRTVTPVSYGKVKAQVQSGRYEFDMTSINSMTWLRAVREGLAEPIDWTIVRKDKVPADAVVADGHGIASNIQGTNLCYRSDKFPDGGPKAWADFWDVKRFPGNRGLCISDSPRTLIFALLADGVPREKLYPLDLDRAFAKLDEIKPHIKVWWREGSQSQQLIRDGEVDMIAMWSARAIDLIEDKVPVEIVWNGAEIYYANLLVPKGDPNAAAAWEFCNFVAQAKPQADFATLLPYGPANPGARALMAEARLRQTPAWPENEKLGFKHDAAWIAPRLAQIRERWTQWLTT